MHRNWPLIALHLGYNLLSFLLALVILVVPLVVLVVAVGINSAAILSDPMEGGEALWQLLMGNLWALGIFIFLVLVYLTIVMGLWIFVLGGSAGVLGRWAQQPRERFEIDAFFRHGRELFWPLTGYLSVTGAVVIAVYAMFALAAVVLAVPLGVDSDLGTLAKLTVGALALGALGLAVLVSTLVMMGYTLQGLAPLVMERTGTWRALARAWEFVWHKPGAVGLWAALFGIYMGAILVAVLVVVPLRFLPVVGGALAIPFDLLMAVLQGYLALGSMSAVFVYYGGQGVAHFSAAQSRPEPDISRAQDDLLELFPEQREPLGPETPQTGPQTPGAPPA